VLRLGIPHFRRFPPFLDRLNIKHTFFIPQENKPMLMLNAPSSVRKKNRDE
jgi:hypothetical protein